MIDTIRQLVMYDPFTGIFVWKYRDRKWFKTDTAYKSWNTKYAGKTCFNTVDLEGYHIGSVLGKKLYAHRVAWALINNQWPDNEIDHENGIRSDNRYLNLFDKTHKGNGLNQGLKITNTSGVNGVQWHKNRKKWHASIRIGGKLKHIGVYKNIDEAAQARRKAEIAAGFHPNHGKRLAVRSG